MLALYGHPFSSYTWKAIIPLYANETPFEFREVSPDHPEHAMFIGEAHPAGKFPVLDDGGTVVVEATSIVEYLAVHHPGPAPLLPTDPAAAVAARMLDRVFDNYVMTPMTEIVFAYIEDRDNPDQQTIASARERLLRAYRWLERWLSENTFPPHVSLVTCAGREPGAIGAGVVHAAHDRGQGEQLRAQRREARAVFGDALDPVGVEQRGRRGAGDQADVGRQGVGG